MSTHGKSISDLNQQVLRLYSTFCDLVDEQVFYSVHSVPKKVQCYNFMIDHYTEGIDACVGYFQTLDILEFVKDLEKNGFYKEIIILKDYIEDPATLNYITELEEGEEEEGVEEEEEEEEEIFETDLISNNGGFSEGVI